MKHDAASYPGIIVLYVSFMVLGSNGLLYLKQMKNYFQWEEVVFICVHFKPVKIAIENTNAV